MSDTWDQLQAHKRKHENLKERLAKRRKERQAILDVKPGTSENSAESANSSASSAAIVEVIKEEEKPIKVEENVKGKQKNIFSLFFQNVYTKNDCNFFSPFFVVDNFQSFDLHKYILLICICKISLELKS